MKKMVRTGLLILAASLVCTWGTATSANEYANPSGELKRGEILSVKDRDTSVLIDGVMIDAKLFL